MIDLFSSFLFPQKETSHSKYNFTKQDQYNYYTNPINIKNYSLEAIKTFHIQREYLVQKLTIW